MSVFHSILIPYRDRPEHLQLCLEALHRANPSQPTEVILVDLGSVSRPDVADLGAHNAHNLKVEYHRIDWSGPFWKTKALNFALSKAKGVLVTPLDVDMLAGPQFLSIIEGTFKNYQDEPSYKLAHHICLMDEGTTEMVRNRLQLFYMGVVNNRGRFEQFPMEYSGRPVGWSCFTVEREVLLAYNGWNESFIAYGLEDVELNQRLHRMALETRFSPPAATLFHLSHKTNQAGWRDKSMEDENQRLFTSLMQEDWPDYERPADWGVFPQTAPAVETGGRDPFQHQNAVKRLSLNVLTIGRHFTEQ